VTLGSSNILISRPCHPYRFERIWDQSAAAGRQVPAGMML